MNQETMSEAGPPIWRAGASWSQTCSAHRSDGEPCRAWSIVGGNVCVYHGGKAPQVREAARKRLEALAPLAIEVLAGLVQGGAIDPTTGAAVPVPPVVRVRAAAEILSRAGFSLTTTHDVTVTPGLPNPELDEAIAAALRDRVLTAPESQDP